ncbi:MAG: EAL domain-containing protein [Rhodospirillales bacterium]|nr:EAL domain-containing protein [Rhodospirillales bacterium]
MAEAGYATGAYREPETSEEALLLARLKRVETNPAGVYAVHVHLSKLRPNNRQPHFLSIAQRSFDGLIESYEATVFPLSNADIVVICRNAPVDDTDAAVGKIRALFSEDPLLAGEKGGFEDPFSTWYDLSQPEDFSSFASVANQLAIEAQRTRQQQTAETKVKVEDKGHTRVADLMREQTCLEMGPEGPGNIVFREHFISVADLKKRIAPDVNLFASPWLFQYLTETLDKRVLAVLANRGVEKATSPLSLNLNVNTILSRDFQNFHKVIDKNAKKVVIEMQVLDIFADMNTFVYARDLLQERGYRVLLDGLNPLALQFIEPGKLKTDFVKIAWGPEFEGETDSGKMAQMREVVTATGKDSVILARVDTEHAVKWGIALGVKRFQGYYVDDLMKKIADVQIQKAKAQAAARAAQPVPPPRPAAAPAPVRTPAQAQPRPTAPARPAAPAQPAPARSVQPGQAQPRPAAPAPARPVQPGQVPPRPAQPGHMPQRPASPAPTRPAQPGQVPPRPAQPVAAQPRPAAPAQPRPVAPGPGAPKR